MVLVVGGLPIVQLVLSQPVSLGGVARQGGGRGVLQQAGVRGVCHRGTAVSGRGWSHCVRG